MIRFFQCLLLVCHLFYANMHTVLADVRFKSNFPCTDSSRICVSSGKRMVDGFETSLGCFEYSYEKTCNYPSRNDCRLFQHCYRVGQGQCLLRDSLGSCVNMQHEFSCKSWLQENRAHQEARVGLVDKAGPDSLICKGAPCLDGNCVDKSYVSNGEMMDALSKLSITSKMQAGKDGKVSLFSGTAQYCEKKPVGYSNCCRDDLGGWGHDIFNVKCTKDELQLSENRRQNLCVYVGKSSNKNLGVTTNIRHQYCCFGSVLNKVVQVQARAQLGRGFGSSAAPDCSGLSLEQIAAIDWSKLDLSEVIDDLRLKIAQNKKQINAGDVNKVAARAKANINQHFNSQNKLDPANQKLGINQNVKLEE